MRNSLVGAVLAVVLIAALFAAARFGSHPAPKPTPAPVLSPAEIAAQIKPDFVGMQMIGDWKLTCGEPHVLPQSPPVGGRTGNSQGKSPAEAPPPPGWRIPRCRATVALRNPKSPAEEVLVTFRLVGFKRALAAFVRMPPTVVTAGEQMTLRLDATELVIPVRGCAAQFCLAVSSIRMNEEPAVLAAKNVVLIFTSTAAQKPTAVTIPTLGLKPALVAMRRIDT